MQKITDTVSELQRIHKRFSLQDFIEVLDFLALKSGVQNTANYLNIHYNTLQNWRSGKSSPSICEVTRILTKLGYNLEVTMEDARY